MIAIRKNQELGLGCRVFEPTPKDIRRACDAIQATWSPRTGQTVQDAACAVVAPADHSAVRPHRSDERRTGRRSAVFGTAGNEAER